MFKIVLAVLALTSLAPSMASPKPALLAPVVAPAVVTSSSSQYYHRQHNALVTPFIAQPIATPVVVEPFVARAVPSVPAVPAVAQPIPRTPEEGLNPLAETFSPLRQAKVVGERSAFVAAPLFNPLAAPYFANQVFA